MAQKLVARNERISDFAIDGLVGVFDQRLFLTDDQRKDVRKNLHRIVGRRLFYQPFVLYSEYGVRGLLDDEQFRRGLGPKATEVLRAGAGIKILRPRVQVKCMYIEPEEDRQRSLERAVASALFLLEDQVNQQIRVLKDRFSLNNADRKKLETAGKGILLRAERRWIASLSAQVKEMEERVRQRNKNVNTPMTLRTSVSGSLLEEPIWVNMVNRVALGKPPRREQSRRGMVSQMMAVLDRELWLMPDQVEPLKALVDKVVEDIHTTSIQRQAQQAHTEVMTIKNAEIDKVLTPNQMKVWQLLKDPKNIPVRRMERLGRRL